MGKKKNIHRYTGNLLSWVEHTEFHSQAAAEAMVKVMAADVLP